MSAPLLAEDYPVQQGGRHTGQRNWRLPGGVLFAILIAVALGLGALHVLDPRTLPIRHVRINGEFRHLSPAAMQEAASGVVRGGFFNVNVDAVRAALLREPWVRNVTVRRVWPDALSLQVTEQVPVARWGDAGLLNGDAAVFAPEPSTWPDGLPLFSAPAGAESMMLKRYRHMADTLAGLGLKVARVHLDERRSWSLTVEGGPEVILGRRDSVSRFDRFATVLPGHLLETLDRVTVVDMRYTNGFAVRWREAGNSELRTVREEHGEEG
jgi:cell division protein FtsQ